MRNKEELKKNCYAILDQLEEISTIKKDMMGNILSIGKYFEYRKLCDEISEKLTELQYKVELFKDDLDFDWED